MRLLEETVKELKGEEVPLEIHATLNLGLDIRIPVDYISDDAQRLRSYKRIADVKDEEQAARIAEELSDRYGPVPEEVTTLLRFSAAQEPGSADWRGIHRSARQAFANIKFHQQSKVDPLRLMAFVRTLEGAQFTPAGVLKVPLRAATGNPAGLIEELKNILLELTAPEPVAAIR